MQVLVWRAFSLNVQLHCETPDGTELGNLRDLIGRGAIPHECQAVDASKAMHRPVIVRVCPELGRSGLWTAGPNSRMFNYDQLDIPFSLLRRMMRWQQEYEELANPYAKNIPDNHWNAFDCETLAIAREFQDYLGTATLVEILHNGDKWQPIRDYSIPDIE